MSQPLVIGLAGYPGCGKDELLNQISKEGTTGAECFRKEKFAYGIHDVLAVMCGFYESDLSHRERFENREWKEKGALTLAGEMYTPRYLLQRIGTECFREVLNKDVWVKSLEQRILKDRWYVPVITDLRFQNEYEWLRSRGGILIYIDRPSSEERAVNDSTLAHASEAYIPELKKRADVVISNKGSLEQYQSLCMDILEDLVDLAEDMYDITDISLLHEMRDIAIGKMSRVAYFWGNNEK